MFVVISCNESFTVYSLTFSLYFISHAFSYRLDFTGFFVKLLEDIQYKS